MNLETAELWNFCRVGKISGDTEWRFFDVKVDSLVNCQRLQR